MAASASASVAVDSVAWPAVDAAAEEAVEACACAVSSAVPRATSVACPALSWAVPRVLLISVCRKASSRVLRASSRLSASRARTSSTICVSSFFRLTSSFVLEAVRSWVMSIRPSMRWDLSTSAAVLLLVIAWLATSRALAVRSGCLAAVPWSCLPAATGEVTAEPLTRRAPAAGSMHTDMASNAQPPSDRQGILREPLLASRRLLHGNGCIQCSSNFEACARRCKRHSPRVTPSTRACTSASTRSRTSYV
mmetsp:Transcript_149124/g.277941  ORF Transcript_149124/g.277941 Transcript_149124/m.277941 type:complete len:251 (-) Transcript_149124:13-765(-)